MLPRKYRFAIQVFLFCMLSVFKDPMLLPSPISIDEDQDIQEIQKEWSLGRTIPACMRRSLTLLIIFCQFVVA